MSLFNKIKMKNIIIGNTSFYVPHFIGVSKEDFFKTYAPLGVEVEEAYQLIQEEINKMDLIGVVNEHIKSFDEKIKEDVSKPNKKSK